MGIDAEQLRAQCLYESRMPLASLRNDLEQVGNVLRDSAARRRRLKQFGAICLLVSTAAFVAGAVSGNGPVSALGAVLFAGGIVVVVRGFRYASQLVRNRGRFDLLSELLKILGQDADAKQAFAVRLSLQSDPKLMSESPWLERKKGKQQFFREAWISVEAPLLDGTVLSEHIMELSRKRTYVNPRGKWKTKTRSRYLLTVRCAYSSEIYGDAREAQKQFHEEVRVPPSAFVRGVRVTEKAIVVKAMVGLDKEITQTSAMLWMGAYRILNLCRRSR